jgi:hypothetical protein
MGFLRHAAILLGILTLLFGTLAAGLAIAAYGTWALQRPGLGPLPLAPVQALALVLLGFSLLPAALLAVNARGAEEHRRRYGFWALAAGLPDLVIAWTYIAVLVAPELLDARSKVMAAMLVVEFLASYTTITIAGLLQAEKEGRPHRLGKAPMLVVLAVTLPFVGYAGTWADSWLPVAGYFALAGKRILLGLLEPARTAASLPDHQIMRCAVPLSVLFFIGVPLFLFSKSLEMLLFLGILNFAFMALLEMALQATPVRAEALRLYTDPDAHWGSEGKAGGRHRRG